MLFCGQMYRSAIASESSSNIEWRSTFKTRKTSQLSTFSRERRSRCSRVLRRWKREQKAYNGFGWSKRHWIQSCVFWSLLRKHSKTPSIRNPISEACAALSLVLSPGNLWDLCPAMDAGLAPIGHSQFGELCFCRFLLYPSVLSKKSYLQMCTWSSLKSVWAQSGEEACGLIVGTSTWCLVAILKHTVTLIPEIRVTSKWLSIPV